LPAYISNATFAFLLSLTIFELQVHACRTRHGTLKAGGSRRRDLEVGGQVGIDGANEQIFDLAAKAAGALLEELLARLYLLLHYHPSFKLARIARIVHTGSFPACLSKTPLSCKHNHLLPIKAL
jgi:hypothetical protein